MSRGERLIARLRAMGYDLPADTVVAPTYAGRQQRNAGAWVWRLYSPGESGMTAIGSQFPLAELLAAPMIDVTEPDRFGDRHVDVLP